MALRMANFNEGKSLKGVRGMGTGMLWGILMFIGFESIATLGEEDKGSRKTIPSALFTAVLVVGTFYVFAAYGVSSGFGPHDIETFASDSDTVRTLSQKFWGGTATDQTDDHGQRVRERRLRIELHRADPVRDGSRGDPAQTAGPHERQGRAADRARVPT